MTERPFQFKKIKQEDKFLSMPPAWCSSICTNAMNEVCVEQCAIKRDCSGFEAKPNLTFLDMPRFPSTEGMSREEKFTSVTIYLAKVIDHLQGIEDEHRNIVVRPPVRRQGVEKPKEVAEVAGDLLAAVVQTRAEDE